MAAMKRYTSVPITLYRIQLRLPVSLRDHAVQVARNRTSFDLKLHDGLVMPMPPNSPFHTPNGMSVRPVGPNMISILENFKGEPRVYRLQQNTKLPEELCVFHEHSDHYSIQAAEEMPLSRLNAILTTYLESLPSNSKQEFLEMWNDEDDQDN
uniref:Tse2 ADP-ribosyltransferase toxin domain-containing protein n=1 Tax=Spongospora subterranea TaxID=70186 RepID=A0A0H5RQ10_9EUKA|eukprot:CRZ10779.1 hypothetical protein [Spongospora subterranea]